ncbi:MAG: DnaB-like helicase C-terminal domain-containing protein [Candidatus Sericytochromatia bacterium]
MTNIKELLDFQIYPSIYNRLDSIFPEFGFKRIGNGYLSTTKLKIDGTEGKEGKVYVYDNNISCLIDYTRGTTSIWNYVQEQKGLSNFETLKYLAELAGVTLSFDYKADDIEAIKENSRNAEIWEEANNFFIECLNDKNNAYFNTVECNELRAYIKDRGYNENDLKVPQKENISSSMELGYIPSQELLFKYLENKGFSKEEVSKKIQLNINIGRTHKLTIPYRDNLGRIRGIICRNINHKNTDESPKYLYSTGLKRDDILFNLKFLKGNKDLIIVEGILDCLIAETRGIENIVALGGTSLNSKQVELAKKYGAKKVTLCLDNDDAGKKATLKAIEILKNSGLKIYVSSLPEAIKDPDQLIKECGIEAFKEKISQAQSYYMYMIDKITEPYNGKEYFTDKDRDEIIEASYELFEGLTDPLEREIFYSVLKAVSNDQITEQGFKNKSEELKIRRQEYIQKLKLESALNESSKLLKIGNLRGAIQTINESTDEIQISQAESLIDKYSYSNFLEDLRNTPLTLKTGIKSLDLFAGIPHGAITLIAGRPSHGKTTFMFNLLINLSKIYTNKKFYFFSYEEQKKFILAKILNKLINKEIYLPEYPDCRTNLEFLKAYIKENRTDNKMIESGKESLKYLLESGKIEIIDRSYSVEELSLVINHLHSKENLGAIFIDYVQRIRTDSKTQDKRNEIAYISDYILNNIAKKTGLPVILGAQFNRGAGESPRLEHLKEAGNLEEDANLVLSVYQEARENEALASSKKVTLEIKALKNRDGEVNRKTILDFYKHIGNIEDPISSYIRSGK